MPSKRIVASRNALLADGWTECKRDLLPAPTWPNYSRIVLEKVGCAVVHTSEIYTDSSDYQGHDWPVGWSEMHFKQVTKWALVEGDAAEQATP